MKLLWSLQRTTEWGCNWGRFKLLAIITALINNWCCSSDLANYLKSDSNGGHQAYISSLQCLQCYWHFVFNLINSNGSYGWLVIPQFWLTAGNRVWMSMLILQSGIQQALIVLVNIGSLSQTLVGNQMNLISPKFLGFHLTSVLL